MKYLAWSSTKCTKENAIELANGINPILSVAHQVEVLRITDNWWGLVSNHPNTDKEIDIITGKFNPKTEGA